MKKLFRVILAASLLVTSSAQGGLTKAGRIAGTTLLTGASVGLLGGGVVTLKKGLRQKKKGKIAGGAVQLILAIAAVIAAMKVAKGSTKRDQWLQGIGGNLASARQNLSGATYNPYGNHRA